mgnify:FL=1|tara:strand:- start:33 stop:1082 length:1050 start_codon:yes stop_codon:yes gene_type:complete
MAYTSIDDPSGTAFNTVLYTGNASTRSITGVGFQPDWVWIKVRNYDNGHQLFDVVRGVTKRLQTDTNGAEATRSSSITSFDSDGFSMGADAQINDTSSYNYVAWNWKAGTSFSNDASATSVGSIDSSGSINTTVGFSIITYTGTGSAATFAHGLSAVPKCILFKKTSGSQGWGVYHDSIGNTGALSLNTTDATDTTANYFNNTSPTSSVVTVNTNNSVNNSGGTMIAYCFAEKKGYSKFGKYTGNGSTDGTFIYTGFKPAFFMLKKSSATDPWVIFDNKRATSNPFDKLIYPDSNEAESGSSERGDFLSNGVKFRSNHTYFNGSGIEYIYMAFAESPFVNSNGVPNNAR